MINNAPLEKLVIGVSSRALFDTADAEQAFASNGGSVPKYIQYQTENDDAVYDKGPVFDFLSTLAKFQGGEVAIEIVVISKNDPSAVVRIQNSILHHELPVARESYVGGRAILDCVRSHEVDLFLTTDRDDVTICRNAGISAALVFPCANAKAKSPDQPFRVAFDADDVLFSNESSIVYAQRKLDGYQRHELENAFRPIPDGPLARTLRLLVRIRDSMLVAEQRRMEIAVITARNGNAARRLSITLRQWGIGLDVVHFLGKQPKRSFIEDFNPHIYFDDDVKNIVDAAKCIPCAQILAHPVPCAQFDQKPLSTDAEAQGYRLVQVDENPVEGSLGKEEFKANCSMLFRQYLPKSVKRQTLPRMYADFIATNSTKSSAERFRIFQKLSKYSLSGLSGLELLYHRETEDEIRRKLNQISEG